MAVINNNVSAFQNKEGQWGLVEDSSGQILLPAEYSYIDQMSENNSFYIVYSGPRPNKIYTIFMQYRNDASHHLYAPSEDEERQGYRVGIFSVEKKKLILEPKYYSVLYDYFGLFLVEGQNKYGYKGYGIMTLSGWWNVFCGPKSLLICNKDRYIARFGQKQYLIGSNHVTYSIHDRISRNEGICLCWDGATSGDKNTPVIGNGVFSYIDLDGKDIFPGRYVKAGEFSEGMAFIQKDGKYGYINNKGEEVIPCIYEEAKRFSFSLAAVKKNGKWGYINPKNETVFDFIYESAGTFGIDIERDISFGCLTAQVKSREYTDIINCKGKILDREENEDDTEYSSSGWTDREIREAYEAATGKSWYD